MEASTKRRRNCLATKVHELYIILSRRKNLIFLTLVGSKLLFDWGTTGTGDGGRETMRKKRAREGDGEIKDLGCASRDLRG